MKNLIYVFLIAILPIIELRGAIPVGAALGNNAFLNALAAILGNLLPVPFILLFIPKILDLLERVRFFAPIVRWVRRKADKHKGKILKEEADAPAVSEGETAAEAAEASVAEAPVIEASVVETSMTEASPIEASVAPIEAAPEKTRKKRGAWAAFWGLLLFVMIPLPGTGAWTGSLVASLFDMPKKRSFPAVILGVLGCAVIMSLASYGVVGFLSIFL